MNTITNVGVWDAGDWLDESEFLARMERNVDKRNQEVWEESLLRLFISMLDTFNQGNNFEWKDSFGNLIFIPCPPKLAIEWLDINQPESVRFLYTLYLIWSSRASLVWEVAPLKEKVQELVRDGMKNREYGL